MTLLAQHPPLTDDSDTPGPVTGFRWLRMPLTIFVLSRIAIFAVSGYSLLVDNHLARYQAPVDSNLAIQGLTRWDSGWFLLIAKEGYTEPTRTNFFPLFPLAGRLVSKITGLSLAASLVLCANACSLASLILIYRIFLEIEAEPAATAALGLLVAWPFSFFQAAGYSESMMMLSTAGATYLAFRHRHLAAGVVLGAGVLARHLSAFAGLTLLAQQIRERGWRPRNLIWHRDFLGLLVPLASVWIYFGFLSWRFGSWRTWLDARKHWGRSAYWGLDDYFTQSSVRLPEITYYIILSILPGVGAALLLSRARWRVLAPFGIGLMVLLWSIGLAGLGRYCGTCWPAFLPLGALLSRRRDLLIGLICAMALLQGMTLQLFAHLFIIN